MTMLLKTKRLVTRKLIENSNFEQSENNAIGRSKCQRKQPKWMKDGEFVVNMVFRAMMNAVPDKN